jgi:hypothetical protein
LNKSKGLPGGVGQYRKVTITLTPPLEEWLDHLRTEIRRRGGKSLGRTELIRASLAYVQTLDLDVTGVTDEVELAEHIRRAAEKKR